MHIYRQSDMAGVKQTTSSSGADSEQEFDIMDGFHWYNHPKYKRYWTHYERCLSWFKKHIYTCKKLSGETYSHDRNVSICRQWEKYHIAQTQWWYLSYQQWVSQFSYNDTFSNLSQMPFMESKFNSNNVQSEDKLKPAEFKVPPIPKNKTKEDSIENQLRKVHLKDRQESPKRQATRNISDASSESGTSSASSSKHHRKRKRKRKRKKSIASQTELSESDIHDMKGPTLEMEITKEMLEFFAHSAKHKQERDAVRKENEEKEGDYINLSEASTKHRARCTAPTEQPGLRRAEEMKQLYGKGAAMIHGMETAMQLNFDRLCDRMQSKPWPNIPLNVKFD